MEYWRTATGQCFHTHPVCFGLRNARSTHPTADIYGLRPCSLCDGTDPCTGDNCAECAYQKKCIEEDTMPLKQTWGLPPTVHESESITTETPPQTEPSLPPQVDEEKTSVVSLPQGEPHPPPVLDQQYGTTESPPLVEIGTSLVVEQSGDGHGMGKKAKTKKISCCVIC